MITGIVVAALTAFVTLFAVASVSDMGGSDAAGNGMAEGFATLGILALYFVTGLFALIAMLGGDMPYVGRAAYALLIACAGVAIWMAFTLLLRPSQVPGQWPIAIVAGTPALAVAYGLWALIAPLRAAVGPRVAGGVLLGGLALLSLCIVPMSVVRNTADEREAARVAGWQARFDATPGSAPLQQWLPFLNSDVYSLEEAARQKILALPTREHDAEAMLDGDTFPFGRLSEFDFDPTPEFCSKALASLSRRAAAVPPSGAKSTFDDVSDQVAGASAAITWLVSFACSSDAQSSAWEAVARRYGATDYQVDGLVQARDPKRLGSVLYNSPPHAAMLTSKASLHAWLSFAWGPGGIAPDAATYLEGARKLNHRTADAVTWLTDPYAKEEAWELTRFIPELDLEPTPQLCAAALNGIGADLTDAYHPTEDNPLDYSELDDRLGQGRPLQALVWLAGHGCAAQPQIEAAEALVKSYRPAPEREAMLAALAATQVKQ